MMLLRQLGSRESMPSLRRSSDIGRDGMSLNDMRDLLANRGVTGRIFKANAAGLGSLALPIIIFWENYHFVILESLNDVEAVIVDPASGRRRVGLADFISSFSGFAMSVEKNDEFSATEHKTEWIWKDFLTSLKYTKKSVILSLLLTCIVFATTLVVPMMTQRLIDAQVASGTTDLSSILLVAAVGSSLGYFILLMLRVQHLTRMMVVIGRHTMGTTFGRLLRLPYKYFGSRSPGELVYRLNSVSGIRDLLSTQLVGGILDIGMLIFVSAYMSIQSMKLAMIAGAFFLGMTILLFATRSRVSEALDNEMTELSKSQSLQLEAVVSIQSIKLAGMEDQFLAGWTEVYERALTRLRSRAIVQGFVTSAVTVVQTLAPIVVLIVGLSMVANGEMTIGGAIAFQVISTTFFGLASSIFGSYTQYLLAGSYLERIADINQSDPELWSTGGHRGALMGNIKMANVGFAYSQNGAEVLHGITCEVRQGQKLAIVGQSGSGKTSLGKILAGLYRPTSGSVHYDGRPAWEYDRRYFFESLGVVPQEISLQNKSVMDNITMGHSALTIEDVIGAAEAVRIDDEIRRMPMGYNTLVSEMGMNFSGGQRQRLALARAIARRPKILILDEATSSLDIHNEAQISDFLKDLQCTQIVIAHRMSTVLDADLILVMKDGQVVDRGTHETLSAGSLPYRELFETQLRERVAI